MFHDLLDLISGNEALERFRHPALSVLSQYDLKKGTELYRTLQAHLRCSGNLKMTAAELFIHRNSLTYRMERIVELTGIDLSDSYTRFLLLASYEIDFRTEKS
jgi:DNA-binding PucR family transcriptional regulator